MFSQAIAAGAKELLPVKDQFYGDRSGGVTDPFGHVWYIATHIEDVFARRDEEAGCRAPLKRLKELTAHAHGRGFFRVDHDQVSRSTISLEVS